MICLDLQGLIMLLVVCTLAMRESLNSTTEKDQEDLFSLYYDYADYKERPFSDSCPQECLCTISSEFTAQEVAKCNELQLGTQIFREEIKEIIIENAEVPIHLDNFIFKKLGLNKIYRIKIVNSTISSVGSKAFFGLPELYAVTLSNNNLTLLHPETFAENNLLDILTLSSNPLKFPGAGSQEYFLNASSVQELDVSYCNMQYITANTFKNMPRLMHLNIAGNNLSDLDPAETFPNLLDFEEVDPIDDYAFHRLVKLTYLDLSYNDLDFIYARIIEENIMLQVFKISNNPRLKHLPEEGFNSNGNLFIIEFFDASNCGLEEIYDDSLKTFIYLSKINLCGNKIKSISDHVFSHSPRLVDINLAYNMLTTLAVNVFKKNYDLRILNLQGNPLNILSAEVFIHTPLLTWLDVSHAELTALWKGKHTTKILRNLSFLNISDNRITKIEQFKLDMLKNLHTLDISNNLLLCSPDFQNLMIWLRDRNVSPNANTASIADLAKNTNDKDGKHSWDFLLYKTCSIDLLLPGVRQKPRSDEEIWIRNTDDEANNKEEGNNEDKEDDNVEDYDDHDLVHNAILYSTSKHITEAPYKFNMSMGDKHLDNDRLYDDLDTNVYSESVKTTFYNRHHRNITKIADDDKTGTNINGDSDDEPNNDEEEVHNEDDENYDTDEIFVATTDDIADLLEEDRLNTNMSLGDKYLDSDKYDKIEQNVLLKPVKHNVHNRQVYLWLILIIVLGLGVFVLLIKKRKVMMLVRRRSRQTHNNRDISMNLS